MNIPPVNQTSRRDERKLAGGAATGNQVPLLSSQVPEGHGDALSLAPAGATTDTALSSGGCTTG